MILLMRHLMEKAMTRRRHIMRLHGFHVHIIFVLFNRFDQIISLHTSGIQVISTTYLSLIFTTGDTFRQVASQRDDRKSLFNIS